MPDFSVVAGYGVVLSPTEFQSIVAYRYPELTAEEVVDEMWEMSGGTTVGPAEEALGVKIHVAGNSITGDNVFVIQAANIKTHSMNEVEYDLIEVSDEVQKHFPQYLYETWGLRKAPSLFAVLHID